MWIPSGKWELGHTMGERKTVLDFQVSYDYLPFYFYFFLLKYSGHTF